MVESYLPALIFLLTTLGLGATALGLAAALGPKSPSAIKDESFECGSDPVGGSRIQFDAGFFQIAILFPVLTTAFALLFPWAAAFSELGCTGPLEVTGTCSADRTPAGLIEGLVFLSLLAIAIFCVWRKRALDSV